jgi:hypothetical protein
MASGVGLMEKRLSDLDFHGGGTGQMGFAMC